LSTSVLIFERTGEESMTGLLKNKGKANGDDL
jgi:hypothetical protein